MKMIGFGAEATISSDEKIVVKDRIEKGYRLAEIDTKLRKTRTRQEARILERLKEIGFPSPRLLDFCDKKMFIKMEYIKGKKLRDVLEDVDYIQLAKEIGRKIAILHNNGIIHGDLTTSNMILDNEIYFVDFGLGFFSEKIEDKAVDLHLLRQALESKHYLIWKKVFDAVMEEYKSFAKNSEEIFKRLEKVEKRGRNKHK